jgi:hypothetical protein
MEGNWGNYSVLHGSLFKKSWKGAAVHRRLEAGSRGRAIVRSRYQATTSEHTAGWKYLSVSVMVICSYDL